jgi:hypothetical protein
MDRASMSEGLSMAREHQVSGPILGALVLVGLEYRTSYLLFSGAIKHDSPRTQGP